MGYTYKPLRGNEIRLIRFAASSDSPLHGIRRYFRFATSSDPSLISFTLEHVNLDSDPTYFALSYVWGDATKLKSILLDGKRFKVTDNLFDALLQINDHVPKLRHITREATGSLDSDFYIWMDAVCIEQCNLSEKSAQVPRMKDVYSKAYNVLVWLGTTESVLGQLTEVFHSNLLSSFMREAQKIMPTSTEFDLYSGEGQLPSVPWIPCSTAMEIFRTSPWFRRIWV